MIQLRLTEPPDLDFVRQAEAHPDNAPFIQQWARSEHAATLNDPDVAHQIVLDVEQQERVGYTILRGLTNPHRSLELKRLVITRKGKGYGRQTLELLQHQVFEQHNAHRFWLDVKDFNQRAYQLYQQLGFVEEGRMRDCLLTDRGFETFVVMSILEDEYRQRLLS